MKKKLLITLLIATSIITFTGCSNASTDVTTPVEDSIEAESSAAIESTMETSSYSDEKATESSLTESTENNVPESSGENMSNVLEDSAQWIIDPSTFKEYCQTEDDLTYYNNYISKLKPEWSDGTYSYHDLQGSNENGIFITYWDSAPFNVYDDQYKTSVLCTVHGINFAGIYQCKETAYIYGYIKTTSDDYYDPFDFEGYGWVDPRELEDGYMISY